MEPPQSSCQKEANFSGKHTNRTANVSFIKKTASSKVGRDGIGKFPKGSPKLISQLLGGSNR